MLAASPQSHHHPLRIASPRPRRPPTRAALTLSRRAPPIAVRPPADALLRPATAAEAKVAKSKWVHRALGDFWRLALNAKGRLEWQRLTPSGEPPPPRSRASLVALASRGLAVLFGGRSALPKTCLNDAHIFDASACAWARITLCGVPPAPRQGHVAAVLGPATHVLVFGGCGHQSYDDVTPFAVGAHLQAGRLEAQPGVRTRCSPRPLNPLSLPPFPLLPPLLSRSPTVSSRTTPLTSVPTLLHRFGSHSLAWPC